MTDKLSLVTAPANAGPDFWRDVFKAAQDAGTQVVIVTGPVKVYIAEGADARINVIDRLFGGAK